MDDQGTIEIEEARMRRLLQHAAHDIGGSQPDPRRVKRSRGRRSAAVVAVTVFALAASAGTGFAVGRSAPTSPTSSVRLASLPTEPPLVEAALKALFQHDPEIVQRVDSVEVKYVTDQEFWDAISNAWQTGNASDCGTFSGPSGAIGHWYVVDLHGKFVSAAAGGVATQFASVDVVMVPATDLQGYLRSMPPYVRPASAIGPAPSGGTEVVIVPPASGPPTNVSASDAGAPPVGTDGEPLCWSLLLSSS